MPRIMLYLFTAVLISAAGSVTPALAQGAAGAPTVVAVERYTAA
jgi:hypothetical protein